MRNADAAHGAPGREGWGLVAANGGFVVAVLAMAFALAAVAPLPLWSTSLAVGLVTGAVLLAFHAQGPAAAPSRIGRFGLANWVTLFRLNLVALMLLAVWPDEIGVHLFWLLFGMAAIALALDGVDGWLARRRQEASHFGARFDMGADTAFTIIVTLCLVRLDLVGPWVILIGLMRPAFVAAARLWPRLALPLPPSRGRKVACGLALGLLVAGLAPLLAPMAPLLAFLALGVLAWSFGRDLRHLLARGAAA
jgi:phosphatidylglycerophosphate synthase